MLGLEWKDIDFESSIISVRRTSYYTVDRGVYTDTTKIKTSQRTLKFPKYIMDLLKELKEYQDGEALKWGNKWVETDRLFTKDNGEPQHPNTTYTWLKRFCKKNDLPFYGLHSYRHRNNTKTRLSQTALLKQISSCKMIAVTLSVLLRFKFIVTISGRKVNHKIYSTNALIKLFALFGVNMGVILTVVQVSFWGQTNDEIFPLQNHFLCVIIYLNE